MPTLGTINYPRLTNEDEFESLVRDVMAREWGDPNTEKFGRKGQKQHGVDVYGQPVDGNGVYRAAQCKLRTTGKQLSEAEIEHEVCEAHGFPYDLDVLYLVTDAPRDIKTQILVDGISEREIANGRFRVVVWFWDSICERLAAYPKLLVRYYPDLFRQVTTYTGIEHLLDTPIQIILVHSGHKAYADTLTTELRMRGVRVTNRKPNTIDDVGVDGVVLSLVGADNQSLMARVAAYERMLAPEATCPAFIVLPDSLRSSFFEALRSLGIDGHRYHLYSSTRSGLANELFEAFFAFGYQRRGQTSTVNLSVRTRDNRPSEVLLDLDWRYYLGIDRHPSSVEWHKWFTPALNVVRRTLLEQSERLRIQFDCHLPIPVAFALGHCFNIRVADVGVWSRRRDEVSGLNRQFWFSQNQAADIHFEPEWVIRPKISGTVAVVELTTYVSIATAVEEYLNSQGIQPVAHVQLPLQVNGQTVYPVSEALALAYADQVGRLIRRLNESGVTDVYVFGRIPSALAVLIGQQLQACNRIHLHWYQNPGYRYAFSLPGSYQIK